MMMAQMQFRMFATSSANDANPPAESPKKPRTRSPKKAVMPPDLDENGEIIPKPKRTRKAAAKEDSTDQVDLKKMYVLKFNSPILPYAKFPLTQNKYI